MFMYLLTFSWKITPKSTLEYLCGNGGFCCADLEKPQSSLIPQGLTNSLDVHYFKNERIKAEAFKKVRRSKKNSLRSKYLSKNCQYHTTFFKQPAITANELVSCHILCPLDSWQKKWKPTERGWFFIWTPNVHIQCFADFSISSVKNYFQWKIYHAPSL